MLKNWKFENWNFYLKPKESNGKLASTNQAGLGEISSTSLGNSIPKSLRDEEFDGALVKYISTSQEVNIGLIHFYRMYLGLFAYYLRLLYYIWCLSKRAT